MPSQSEHPVVILYEHALLGEGIARYILAQTGVEATVALARDLEVVKSALAIDPAVVIFELNELFQQVDLNALAPHAVLIDIGMVISRGHQRPPDGLLLESILQAVRSSIALSPTT